MTRPDEPSVPNYYERLGVSPSASAETIREAYRKKAQETHPDQNPDDAEADERFQNIQEAYRVLRDPERRRKYDAARSHRRVPKALQITQQAPAGCGGYLWRVFAGVVAVVLFFVLEALGVWAAGTWTLLLAVGGTALVAGLAALLLADRVPDTANDVSLRLDAQGLTMWADGRTVLRLPWSKTEAVRLGNDGWEMDVEVDSAMASEIESNPPVLTVVDRNAERALLRLDLSETDVPRTVLVSFLRANDPIPFPPTSGEESSPSSKK